MNARMRAGAVLGLLLLHGCGDNREANEAFDPAGPPAAALRHVAGCYALEAGPWNPPIPDAQDSISVFGLPERIRLGSTVRVRSPDMLRLDVVRMPRERFPLFPAAWMLYAPDSVAIVWAPGYEGVTMRLHIRGDSLVGAAEAWTDDSFVDSRARLALSRIDCQGG